MPGCPRSAFTTGAILIASGRVPKTMRHLTRAITERTDTVGSVNFDPIGNGHLDQAAKRAQTNEMPLAFHLDRHGETLSGTLAFGAPASGLRDINKFLTFSNLP